MARTFLKSRGYDLATASTALISIANLLAPHAPGTLVRPRNQVRVALRLPRTYTDEDLRRNEETMQARARRDT